MVVGAFGVEALICSVSYSDNRGGCGCLPVPRGEQHAHQQRRARRQSRLHCSIPVDDHSIPFQHGVQLNLHTPQTGHGKEPVVPLGESGAHDSEWIAYYGTVLEIDGELWMCYLGQGPDEAWHQCVCLARSKDGRNWEKPDLGLVEYHGSKHNNLVDMGEDIHVQACVIFHEPDDPDPGKRFKMAFETRKHSGLCVAYRSDGLTWRESPNNPVGGWFEMAGGTKVDGCYYLAGQGGKHPNGFRLLVTQASYDFEHWTEATCSGLRRSNSSGEPPVTSKNSGEQVHLGAARLTVNVDGINEHSDISVEIQDRAFRPVVGYGGGASKAPDGPGLAQAITWQGHDLIDGVTGPIRVRVDFRGVRPEDVRLYAVYLDRA